MLSDTEAEKNTSMDIANRKRNIKTGLGTSCYVLHIEFGTIHVYMCEQLEV